MWVSWSGGKDAATALAAARRAGHRVTGLLSTTTSVPSGGAEIAVHGVGTALVQAQAAALALPLHRVELPPACPDGTYRERLRSALGAAGGAGVTGLVCGDLALADVRAFREDVLDGTGVAGVFPLWGADTAALARGMLAAGLRAVVVAVDPARVPAALAGVAFDAAFLDALAPGVDPCGENGEFHTFVTGGPGFARDVPVAVTGTVHRDGHVQAVLAPAG
ncbi:ATP-binding protein [Pseudonocardia spirodelae]|uniref:ATP-binding protein n=1 Tax=Pseudonocardia spirodelae TaxID=3133431 RepID=A0ABU8TBM5_9PSEU